MALQPLSTNESLGDKTTHFFKTGSLLRNPDDKLVTVRALLPKEGPNHTRVEYDLWYDMNDSKRIHGYIYTDAMGKFVYLRVGDVVRTHAIMKKAATNPVTDEGRAILNDLKTTSTDKYKLRKARVSPDFVLFFAGANILNKAVDWDKIQNCVNMGAKIKCHPLSSRDLVALLHKRYGRDNVLDKNLSGYDLLETASQIGCAENSEMGLIGIAKGKVLHDIGCGNKHLTYSAIYNAIAKSPDNQSDALLRILSTKYSGLIPAHAANPQEYVDKFFAEYGDLPHVRPKHTNH